ncbi:YbjQ family protein [Candidatus Epulonipiscium viviparus]|uniref:YbjQ family protein n=1 Tax=Candidatus Epulonipiscium viviparus TaxID=420336 RepID=UPI00273807EB|nr:YbjQ family protein [Candidatus Epulopiscium viviparus]
MLITSTNYIDGKKLEILGLVTGSTVQSKHMGRDIAAGLKNMIGGELRGYTEMLEDARKEATSRMVAAATALEADAIVAVLFSSSTVAQGAAEILAYGTAVKFKN